MALFEMPCTVASALKRPSQLSKLPEVRQSTAEAAVAANSAAAKAEAVQRCLPIRFMIAARIVRMRSAGRAYITRLPGQSGGAGSPDEAQRNPGSDPGLRCAPSGLLNPARRS